VIGFWWRSDAAAARKLIVGLGNPGRGYAETRHNVGFQVIDCLAGGLGIAIRRKRFGGYWGQGEYEGKDVLLLKPWRFINRSGSVVAAAVGFYKLDLADMLVVVDDMSLEPGRIRIRGKGSAGGHNGLADIIERLGNEEFSRLRIGIGTSGEQSAVNFVLGRPSESEKKELKQAIARAKDAVLCWVTDGLEPAMNRYNQKG